MIIGEAPGKREDDSGRPFVGQSGQLLRGILEEHGLNDSNCFITNAVCCRPPANRTPKTTEIKACNYWLKKQIKKVKPTHILVLGNTALSATLGGKGITNRRGKPVKEDGIVYLPAFHPSAISRDPSKIDSLRADIQQFAELVSGKKTKKPMKNFNPVVVTNEDLVTDMLDDLYGTVSFDIETTGLYAWDEGAKVLAIGFGTRKNQWIIPLNHPEADYWSNGQIKSMFRKIDKQLKDCSLVMQNGKFDSTWMRVHYGMDWQVEFDTMLAHYMLDENSRHGLKYLAQIYFGASEYDIEVQGASWEKLVTYHALDLYYTRKLKFLFKKMLKKDYGVEQVFYNILMPCARIFVDAEERGVYVNTDKFNEVEGYLRRRKHKALKKLNKYCKKNPIPDKVGPMNWGSSQQLGYFLFEEVGLTPLDLTKTGRPSTNESVLKRLDHPIVESLLIFKKAKQQLSFFIDGWKPYLDGRRLHPSFKLHGTVTGRFSCEHPNLQQVPRDPRIRSLITAPPGWVFVEADLSQIEMRIAAELSGEQNLLDTFYQKKDVHWKTAMREIARGEGMVEIVMATAQEAVKNGYPFKGKLTYGDAIEILLGIGHNEAISIDYKWKEIRKKAKAINFGFLFGMYYKKFRIYARDNYGIDVTEAEAKAAYDAYFSLYPGLRKWHKRQENYARQFGYVRSLSGRLRRLPLAQSMIEDERKPAMRQGINSPVQSFANELNLMSLIQIHKEFSPMELRIVGAVHDSTLFEIRKSRVHKIVPRILEIMSHPELLDDMNIKLRIPIEAEASVGPWGKGKDVEEWRNSLLAKAA